MATITRGRHTHDPDRVPAGLVVFLIGMRINKPWRVDAWLPVFLAMRPMLAELSRDPTSALLGYTTSIGPGGPMLVQYWRDAESLYAYSSNPTATHRPAWAAFNRRARKAAGAVGIWHETYPVRAAESVYVDMPPTGLARALGTMPITSRLDRARARLDHGSPTAG